MHNICALKFPPIKAGVYIGNHLCNFIDVISINPYQIAFSFVAMCVLEIIFDSKFDFQNAKVGMIVQWLFK